MPKQIIPGAITQPVNLEVDARNLACPLPLLKAKQGLNNISSGELVRVLVSDPASERDFHAFANLSEHTLTKFEKQNDILIYILKKGEK